VKLCRKSLALPEFAQLQSDRSISNLMMSHWSIKGILFSFIIIIFPPALMALPSTHTASLWKSYEKMA